MSQYSRQLRQPRLAEVVADILRQRILTGDLADGDMLPNQEHLLVEFSVSLPSLREALRMLEAEGLITVRRGNVGGAVVHRPEARHAAYTLGLILQGRQVNLADVAEAMRELETLCARLCAMREDRLGTVVADLTRINELTREVIDDHFAYVDATSEFHRSLLTGCGNQTLEILAGTVENLWLSHVQEWAQSSHQEGRAPSRDTREQGVCVHELITDLIARGAVTDVVALVREHFDPTQFDPPEVAATRVVDASMLKSPSQGLRSRSRAGMNF